MRIEYCHLENAVVRVTNTADVPDAVAAEGLGAIADYCRTHDPVSTGHEVIKWAGEISGSFGLTDNSYPVIKAAREVLAIFEAADDDLEELDRGVKVAWTAAQAAKQRRENGCPTPDHVEMLGQALEAIQRLHEADPDSQFTAKLCAGMLKEALACVPA